MQPRIGVQLYSLREEAERDLTFVLARLQRASFEGVELASLHGRKPLDLLHLLADHGLALASTHSLAVGENAARLLDEQAELRSPLVVVPFAAPERFQSEAGVDALADELNTAATLARERGLALGYHNHFWEWTPLADGSLAFDRLLAKLDADVAIELDVYWATLAKQPLTPLLAGLGARATRLHMKDGPADVPASPMTACGEGVVDLAGAARAAHAAVWQLVELDRCATDMFTAVEKSGAHLRQLRERGRSFTDSQIETVKL